MKAAILILLLTAPLALWATDPFSEADWRREGLSAQIPKFKRTTFKPHPDVNGIVAANCETSPDWWGQIRVFHLDAGKIDWIASEPASYPENRGHYILSFEWRFLDKLNMWVLEVFDSTHMGNGSLWLFALEGHDLRLLLQTTARGRFLKPPPSLVVPPLGGTRLLENHLKVEYRAVKGAAGESVFLTGTIAALDSENRQQSSKAFAETWTWDAAKRVFALSQP